MWAERVIGPYKHFTCSHWCIRICRCILSGGQGRPPLQDVLRGRRPLCKFAIISCAGGVEPRPYDVTVKFYEFARMRSNLWVRPAREGQAPPLHYDERSMVRWDGPMWSSAPTNFFTIHSYFKPPLPYVTTKKSPRCALRSGVLFLSYASGGVSVGASSAGASGVSSAGASAGAASVGASSAGVSSAGAAGAGMVGWAGGAAGAADWVST